MKLYVKDNALGGLREVLIDQPDYDALLTLGYPGAGDWHVDAFSGWVVLHCPFIGKAVHVHRLAHVIPRCMAYQVRDGNKLNLRRGNFTLVPGSRNGGTSKARKSLRLAWAAFEQRQRHLSHQETT